MNGNLSKRYALFAFAIFVNSFSIAFITKALLGTSPISSLPYTLSLVWCGTMGIHTIWLNVLFILTGMCMLTRDEIRHRRCELLLLVPITLAFGTFIDVSFSLLDWLRPVSYLEKLATLLVGCVCLALGIALEVKAGVAMITGEFLVQTIARFTGRDFGFVKVCFDVTLVLLACGTGLIAKGELLGVREGTVVCALIVGPIVHFVTPLMRIFDPWLATKEPAPTSSVAPNPESRPLVITITREFGSGGRQLGEQIARLLGIKVYDEEIIALAAKAGDLSEEYISANEQSLPASRLLELILRDYGAPIEKSLSSADRLFVAQSKVIRSLAQKETCVIVGRCADYILSDWPDSRIIRVFCYTDFADATHRCIEEYHMAPDNIETEILRRNHARAEHYRLYTGTAWGVPHRYHLMIHTGSIGIPEAARLIVDLFRHKSG